jgi:hypothetical protein
VGFWVVVVTNIRYMLTGSCACTLKYSYITRCVYSLARERALISRLVILSEADWAMSETLSRHDFAVFKLQRTAEKPSASQLNS